MKRNVTLIFYLSLVFLSGLLVGGFGERLFCTRSVAAAPAPARVSPEEYRRQYVERLTTRLQLAPHQLERLNQILDNTRESFHKLKQTQTDQINLMLTPEQQVEYAKYRKEREERRKLEEQHRQQQPSR
jgi:hypothetical protein